MKVIPKKANRYGSLSSEPEEKPLPSPSSQSKASKEPTSLQNTARKASTLLQQVPFIGTGWRATVATGSSVGIGVLVVNIALLIWGSMKPTDPFTKSRILVEGDCDSMQQTLVYSHLLINILSTLLLAASNAAMQCLSAPTRESIDEAHRKGRWLDIGISGFRNWPYMHAWRKWCWLLLLFSTVPLHIIYNSVVFSTTTANEYFAIVVPSNFRDNRIPPVTEGNASQKVFENMAQLERTNKLIRMDPKTCFDTYNQRMVTEFSNVFVVTKNTSNEMPLASYFSVPTPTFGNTTNLSPTGNWLCGNGHPWIACDSKWLQSRPNNLNMTLTPPGNGGNVQIDHCLSQQTKSQCTVQLIPSLMVVVIIFNTVKIICFITAIQIKSFRPLITLGDALASFISRPDSQTTNLGPLSAADVREAHIRYRVSKIVGRRNASVEGSKEDADPPAVELSEKLPFRLGPWKATKQRWFSGASGLRWGLTYALMLSLWFLGWANFIIAVGNPLSGSFEAQRAIGLGNVSPTALLESTANFGLFGNVILANSIQLIVSLTYLSYNGLFTCILLSHEFTRYANNRAALRVSCPDGHYQRYSYWLNLPYQYGLPLLILSGFLHWAISQSLFLAEVKVNDPLGANDATHNVSCLGYSTLALMITLLLGAVMIFSPLIFGWRSFYPGAPIVESNSIAMSAACHSSNTASAEVLRSLKYGAFPENQDQRVGLTSEEVSPLQSGNRHCTRKELDKQEITILSPAAIKQTRWQMVWAGVIGFLGVAKCVCFALWLNWVKMSRRPANGFLPTNGTNWSMMVVAIPVTFLYVATRMGVASLRKWKKWNLRRFGWHVTPEAIMCFIWIILLYGNVKYNGPIQLQTGIVVDHASKPHDRSIVNLNAAISSGVMLSFFFSTTVEFWLWWQQHRAETVAPVKYSITRLWKKP